MTTIQILFNGPTIKVSDTLQTQACLVHAETDDTAIVIASMPGGAAAGWHVPPVWQSCITTPAKGKDGEEDYQPAETVSFTTGNPRVNQKKEKMWLLVRSIEC